MSTGLPDGRRPRSIAIVGNGPVSAADAPLIDTFEMVLRFNSAPALGAAGQRVDVLLLNRARVYMSKRINPLALHRAPEVWVNDEEENGRVDWLFERECRPRYLGFGPKDKARAHLKAFDPFDTSQPTSGASIIAEFLDVLPGTELHLFGFTHQGRQHTHDWSAEREWVDSLCAEGRIIRHGTPGPLARPTAAARLERALRFVEMRARHYLHNKLLHSDASTKRRIFGRDG